MARNPIVLIHGYSDEGRSFRRWEAALEARGYDVRQLHTCNYRTLTNEVTVKDLGEGLERALRLRAGLDQGEPFDAIVHSTGMLVLRSWAVRYPARRGRLKHLVGLAPATFGSPLAHKGRSWLGALFKGNRDFGGPDFLEAGDRVLDALELGSRFTWDLTHQDVLAAEPFYGEGPDSPYVFTFCGTRGYGGLRGLVNAPGTDGTVRWAGCALNSRKVVLDLTNDPDLGGARERFRFEPWGNARTVLTPIDGLNHATILSDPSDDLLELTDRALRVASPADLEAWHAEAERRTRTTCERLDKWQQFVVRAVDERGDPITDYNLQLAEQPGDVEPLNVDAHAYGGDQSLRCFHVRHADLPGGSLKALWLRLLVSSGTQLVGYYGTADAVLGGDGDEPDADGWWEGWLDLSHLLEHPDGRIFYPFTTTLIELRLNREPSPLDPGQLSRVLEWR